MRGLIHLISLAAVVLFAAAVSAQDLPNKMQGPPLPATGEVRINILKAGFIVGVGGGSGTLTFQGQTYRLAVGGIGVGSLGVADVELMGTATNMRAPSDIAGTYGAAAVGATIVGGGPAATLQNEKGVVLTLAGPQVGFQVSLGLGGMTIALQ